jgi:hypothetical protein
MLGYRLVGLVVALAGAALLLFITYALYTRTETAPNVLVHIGMPATFLLTLFGSFIVGFGVWLAGFAHPSQGERR